MDQYCRLNELALNVARVAKTSAVPVHEEVAFVIQTPTGERQVPARNVNLRTLRVVSCEGGAWRDVVECKPYGAVQILKRVRVPRDHLLHYALMRLQYEIVHTKRVWHILRLYHRVQMWASDSEAIAEHVGSLMRFVEKRHGGGRPLEAAHLVRAVRLRAIGVRGDLTDVALIKDWPLGSNPTRLP